MSAASGVCDAGRATTVRTLGERAIRDGVVHLGDVRLRPRHILSGRILGHGDEPLPELVVVAPNDVPLNYNY